MNKDRLRLEYKLKRIESGLKVKDVANHMGVTSSYISQYENGKADFNEYQTEQYRNFIFKKLHSKQA